ncbi:MAG: InlB B-repeat-containing protein [Clostridia bacterium]|nr:InlB B-repeat-containing protein [Clostridia bacterium]
MKKSKILVATLTAASIAVGCGVFAGCKDDKNGGEENPPATTTYEVTFNANGGSWAENATTQKLTPGTDGKLTALPTPAPTREDYTFASYNTSQDGSGTTISTTYKFTANTTVYAQWTLDEEEPPVSTTEYTITLHVGTGGTLPAGAVTEYKTGADGKINLNGAKSLPSATATTENWNFIGWYTEETGGTAIDERTATFDADADLYARYGRNDGLWNVDGSEMVAAVSVNTGNADASLVEYWFGAGNSETFTEGTVLTVYLNGAKFENFWLKGTCIDLSADVNGYGGVNTSEITITTDAVFEIYLKVYNNGGTTFEFNGTALNMDTTSEIPAGCDPVTITAGAETITLYFVAPDGTAIGSANAADYQIHAWTGGDNLFGAWQDNPTLDQTLTITGTVVNTTGWIIHWTGGQSSAFSNILPGKAYVVRLVTSGDCDVKEYVAPATEA